MKVRQLVYVSASVELMSDDVLMTILEKARIRNEELGITGLLLYAGGNFIQVVEGDPANVEQLYRRIKRDPRHRQFIVMLDHMVEERSFEGWRMGFERMSDKTLAEIAGSTNLWQGEAEKKTAAHRLVASFRRTTAIRY